MFQPEKINIIGTNISNVDLQDTISLFKEWIDTKQKKRICVTPVNCLLCAHDNPELLNIYNTADLTLCDGVPLLWAAKILKTPLKGRVTGLDLFPQFVKFCHERNYSMFLLGASEGVAKALKIKFEHQYPGIQIKGTYSPPFAKKFSEEENTYICNMINAVKPDILWVSLTAPKQDFWIKDHIDKIETHIAIGVGGAFEVTLGTIKRAPVFVQKNGLEWFYRLIHEPRRLFKRYVMEAPRFIPLVLKQMLKGNS